jgi:hypothetical protein
MALGFPERCHGSGRAFDVGSVLFGAYPKERAAWVEPALRSVVESNRGDMLSREEAQRVWEQRFFPASSSGPIPTPGRAFVRIGRSAQTLLSSRESL